MNLGTSRANQKGNWNSSTCGNPWSIWNAFICNRRERRLQCKSLAVELVEPVAWVIMLQDCFKVAGRRLEWFGIAQLYESVDKTWSCKMFQLVKSLLVLFSSFSVATIKSGRNCRNFIHITHVNMTLQASMKSPVWISWMEKRRNGYMKCVAEKTGK